MSTEIRIEIPAEAAAKITALGELPKELLETVRATIDVQNESIVAHIQARRLTAPGATRPLPPSHGILRHVTGRVKKSLRRNDAQIRGETVEGTIGTNVRYAGVHEFGFEGDVQVKAHRAKNAATDVLLVSGGRRIFRWELEGSGAKRAKQVASGTVQVRAHSRRMKIPARAPIARGIEDKAEKTGKALGEAVLRLFP